MNYKLLLFCIIATLTFSQVYAQQASGILNKEEIEIAYGDNATAQLPMLSKTYLRVHEGTKIDFNVVDPDSFNILIKNSMIISEINRNSVLTLLSVDGSEYKETMLDRRYKINYTYDFTPSMFITPIIFHDDDDNTKRTVVFEFIVPFPKTSTSDFRDVKPASLDLGIASNVDPKESVESSEKTGFNKLLVILIALTILVAIVFVVFAIRK